MDYSPIPLQSSSSDGGFELTSHARPLNTGGGIGKLGYIKGSGNDNDSGNVLNKCVNSVAHICAQVIYIYNNPV